MKTRHPYRHWIFVSLLFASQALMAQQPDEPVRPFQAPDWQSGVQNQLQQRLDQRLTRDMDLRFAEIHHAGDEDRRLAGNEALVAPVSPLQQSLPEPVTGQEAGNTLPARLLHRFRHNGASFI